MNLHDKAHELASAIRQSDEYQSYRQARDAAMQNETQAALIKEYKKLQFQLQVSMAGGGKADPGEMERLQKIAAVLQYSPESTAYLMAEFRLQQILADIYKILGEAADIDMDFLQQ